jgi:N-acetylneuraminate synthase
MLKREENWQNERSIMIKERVFIIAEAGVNHNGSLDLAKRLVDGAAEAGADAVKFQTFKAEKLVGKNASKAEYQMKTTDAAETQFEMIKKLELSEAAHHALFEHCARRGIEFLSAPFDMDSLRFLTTLGVSRLKIPSGEITNAPLLLAAAKARLSIILSTGMSTLGDVETALGVLAFGYINGTNPSLKEFEAAYYSKEGMGALRKNVTLLQCTTEYPAPYDEVNLRAMKTLKNAFGLSAGLSDHTPGIVVPIAAAALGAAIIEKHFTLDKNMPGPDHKASLDVGELKTMVTAVRQVETALGSKVKIPAASEIKNMKIARKSIVAACDITKGEVFTEKNLTLKRPGDGISPVYYWEWLGRRAERNYLEDEKV